MGGLTKLFGGKPKTQPVQAMPDEQDPAVAEARRRASVAASARSGRTSTVMTNRAQRSAAGADGGTTAYTNSFLGQG